MKHLTLLLCLIGCSTYCQIQPLPLVIDGTQPLTNGTFGVSNVDNIIYYNSTTQTAQVAIEAATQIELLPGTIAGNFTSPGFFHASTQPSALNVVSFHPNGWLNIPKYDKLELGVKISNTSLAQMNNYFSSTGTTGINPYDPDKYRLVCTFSNGAQTCDRDAFYYRDFNVSNNVWLEKPTDYKFRVRFCPPATGAWTATFKEYINGVLQPLPVIQYTINVVPSNNKGHLTLNNTTRKFTFNDGTPFYAIGQNLWTGGEFKPPCENSLLDCDAHGKYVIHRNWVNDLANNGGNFTRIRVESGQYPVESREINNFLPGTNYFGMNDVGRPLNYFLNNYDHNQPYMWELDQTVDLMNSRNMYFLLCLLEDQTFSVVNPYDWAHRYEWNTNPYATILDTTLTGNKAFFTNTTAKSIYKKYLAYVLARWGYSTNLAAYQMINETHNVAGYKINPNDKGTVKPYATDPGFRSNVDNWICEMIGYVKQKYPSHLATTCHTGYFVDTNSYFNNIPCLDFWMQNDYRNFSDGHGTYKNEDYIRHSQAAGYFKNTGAFLWGELGMPDGNNDIDKRNDRTFHNTNWVSIMSGALGTGMYWNDMGQYGGINHRANFNAIKAYVNNVDWTQSWNPRFIAGVGEHGTVFNGKTIYTFSSFSPDGTKAIAYAQNNSSHWANDPASMYNVPNSIPYDTLAKSQSINIPQAKYDINANLNTDPPIIIDGFAPNTSGAVRPYTISVYKTYGSGGLITEITAYLLGSTLIFPMDMPFNIGPVNYPDYAFIAKPRNLFRMADTLDLGVNSPVDVSPSFISDKKNYTFMYDYGNGSKNADSTGVVNYSTKGDYTISLTIKDKKNDTTTTYYQKVHVGSIKNEIDQKSVIIYPNPSRGCFHIQYDEAIFPNAEITVYNQLGSIIIKQKATTEAINLPLVSSGMYFVNFSSGNYQKSIKLVIEN